LFIKKIEASFDSIYIYLKRNVIIKKNKKLSWIELDLGVLYNNFVFIIT